MHYHNYARIGQLLFNWPSFLKKSSGYPEKNRQPSEASYDDSAGKPIKTGISNYNMQKE
jgi:hypothetical protein